MTRVICPCTACRFNETKNETEENGECCFNGFVYLNASETVVESMTCQSFEWRDEI